MRRLPRARVPPAAKSLRKLSIPGPHFLHGLTEDDFMALEDAADTADPILPDTVVLAQAGFPQRPELIGLVGAIRHLAACAA